MKKMSPQKKAAITMMERYGKDHFSKIGKHYNRANTGKPEVMRELANIRWAKHRAAKELKGGDDGGQ